MNVLVTGGTGFVGREILRELQRAGHACLLLARDTQSPRTLEIAAHYHVVLRPGNILDEESLRNACAGSDAVIHLVGIISEVGRQTFADIHTRGTENIVRAAQQTGVKRFVQMSALGARPNAAAHYHQSKWAAEEIVRRSGLDWTIFRPSIIYGSGDGFVNLFAKIIRRSPLVPIMGRGESKFQPVAVENVAAAFVRSLTEPRAVGQTFDLCGRETLSLNGIVDEILAVMKRKRLKLHVPMGIARVQASFLEFLCGKVLHRPPPLNRDQLVMLQEDNVGDGRAGDELSGFSHMSFREGIARYLSTPSSLTNEK